MDLPATAPLFQCWGSESHIMWCSSGFRVCCLWGASALRETSRNTAEAKLVRPLVRERNGDHLDLQGSIRHVSLGFEVAVGGAVSSQGALKAFLQRNG